MKNTATEEDIRSCFRLLLGREANSSEWPGHAWRVGHDLTDVVRGYLNCNEFSDRGLLKRDLTSRLQEVCTPHGYNMNVSPEDGDVGRILINSNGDYEPHVAARFKSHLRADDVCVDIGANIGFFSLLASSLVKSGRVYAIEPNPENVRTLLYNCIQYSHENISVLPIAAGNTIGLLRMDCAHSNGSAKPLGTKAEAILDETIVCSIPLNLMVAPERVRLIKIDVEGGEYLALRGMESIIETARPTIIMEFTPQALEAVSGISAEKFLGYVTQDLGYQVANIRHDGELVDYRDNGDRIMSDFVSSLLDHWDLELVPN